MGLPSVSRLAESNGDDWAKLRFRLRGIGLDGGSARRLTDVGERLPANLRRSLRVLVLRESGEPAANALRMFGFGDPVTRDEARSALGEPLTERLLALGVLAGAEGGRLVSPFRLNFVDGILVLGDDLAHGGNAVMGAGQTTADLCQAAYPARSVSRILDLGCGAGTVGIVFAGQARSVLGVDVNPRALVFGSVNAALNEIRNIEFRQGDLFAPVSGQMFDLIVAQPPFVPLPHGARPATYLHGGPRGDELPRRALAQLSSHLSPGGRAVMLVEWPIVAEEPLEKRVRTALGSSLLNVLVLRFPRVEIDEYAALYAASMHVELGEAFEREAERMHRHLRDRGVRALQTTLNVIERPVEDPAWTSGLDLPAASTEHVTSARIDRLLAARRLLARGKEALLKASVRVPEGAVVEKENELSHSGEEKVRVRFPESSLVHPVELSSAALVLLSLCDEAPDVRTAAAAFAAHEQAFDDERTVIAAVEEALLKGILEPV